MHSSLSQDIVVDNSLVSVMLEFVRAAVLDKEPEIVNVDTIDWDLLMDISLKQGVLSWVWDGICKMPESKQPPRIVRINYGLSAQEVWDRYKRQDQVLKEMIDICNQNDMRLLLLKGIELSNYYPKPHSRSCGDIDFYLFGDYEKGNKLFSGDNVTYTNKHAEYDYKGVHVENHLTMLDVDTASQRRVECYLEQSLSSSIKTVQGYYILPSIPNLIYLLMHTIRHFVYTLSLPFRNIIDLALFVDSNKNEILSSECKETLERFDLLKSFDLFLYISEWILNKSFKEYRLNLIRQRDKRVILDLYKKYGFVKCDWTHMTNALLWRRFYVLLLFSRYIPGSYNNYMFQLLRCQLVAVREKCKNVR